MKYIKEDDQFGVSKLARSIFSAWKTPTTRHFGGVSIADGWNDNDEFWVFFNQYLPNPWKQDTAALKRHKDEIKELLYKNPKIGEEVWVKKNQQISCINLTRDALELLTQGILTLVTYEEIEKEKQTWQAHKDYRKEEGKSFPIEEEYIMLNIQSRKKVK